LKVVSFLKERTVNGFRSVQIDFLFEVKFLSEFLPQEIFLVLSPPLHPQIKWGATRRRGKREQAGN